MCQDLENVNTTQHGGTHMESNVILREESFLKRAQVELKRAERYHVFLSLICLDLSFLAQEEQATAELFQRLADRVQSQVRVCDVVSALPGGCLALLYPETSRDGAEVAARRIANTIREEVAGLVGHPPPEVIPMEIASFPDAAGAKTVTELLGAIAAKSDN